MLGGHQGRGDVAVHEVELRGADRVQEGERGAPARERLQVEDQRGLPAGQSSHHLECDISEAAHELSEYGSRNFAKSFLHNRLFGGLIT